MIRKAQESLYQFPEYIEARKNLGLLTRLARFNVTLTDILNMDDYTKRIYMIAAQ